MQARTVTTPCKCRVRVHRVNKNAPVAENNRGIHQNFSTMNTLLQLTDRIEKKYRSAEPIPEYFEIFAMIHRPVEFGLDGEYESKMIQLTTLNDGKPQRPKIEAMVAKSHPGWTLWHWWTPEPDDF